MLGILRFLFLTRTTDDIGHVSDMNRFVSSAFLPEAMVTFVGVIVEGIQMAAFRWRFRAALFRVRSNQR